MSTLTHHWRFQNTLTDSVAGETFASLSGSPTISYVDGVVGSKQLQLSVASGFGTIGAGDIAALDFDMTTQDWSVSLFFGSDAASPTGVTQQFFGKKASFGASSRGWQFYQTSTGSIVFRVSDGTNDIFWNIGIQDVSTDIHLAFTWDSDAHIGRVYAGGAFIASTPNTAAGSFASLGDISTTEPLAIDVHESRVSRWDDIRVYDGTLTAQEVADLAALTADPASSSTALRRGIGPAIKSAIQSSFGAKP